MEETQNAENPEFLSLVRELLPEGWRREVRIERASGCVFVRFRDEAGHAHAFDIRVPQSEFVATVEGPRLAYSYIEVDPEVDALDLLEGYRAALQNFAAHESRLLPFVLEPSPPRPDCIPASPALREALVASLPEEWRRNVVAFSTLDGFEVHFSDESGLALAFDGRWVDPATNAMARGERMEFAYVIRDPRADTFAWYERYREALKRFVANEAAIAVAVEGMQRRLQPPPKKSEPTEDPLLDPQNLIDAPAGLQVLLTALVPEAWRQDVRSYLTDEGFLVCLRDAEGRQHRFVGHFLVFRAKSLVTGERLGFNFEGATVEATAPALLGEYEALLKAFAAQEGGILPFLRPPPEVTQPVQRPRRRRDPRALSQSLLELFRGVLPEAWRADATAFFVAEDTISLRARDELGVLHAIQCDDISRCPATVVRGARMGCWYSRLDPRLDEEAALPLYREIMGRLVAQEDEIVRLVDSLGAR